MAGTIRALCVVCLVVTAGCMGISESLPEHLVGTGDPDNPYPDDELTVAVVATHSERAFVPLVREALAYWEHHDERYLDYSVNFTLAPNATEPDLRVTFVPELDHCGEVESAAGCAPLVTGSVEVTDTIDIRALDGLSNDSTVRVLEHELGHALGLDHDDAPTRLMRPYAELSMLPAPNATERALAWDEPTLSVYIALTGVPPAERDAVRAQVGHALSYFDRGANGTVPKNVSFRVVASPVGADVVIRFPADSPCGFGVGSCGWVSGVDTDGDGALERYTRLEIALTGIDTETVGWHVARRLALGFGVENESDYPPVLRESTSEERRRSDWWR